MAGSPIRAPLSNLIFPQPEAEKSPLMAGSTGRNTASPMQSRSPSTYSRFPEGSSSSYFSENAPTSSPPPMKKRCLDLTAEGEASNQNQHPSQSNIGEPSGAAHQQVHDCSSDSLQTNSTSLSPKVPVSILNAVWPSHFMIMISVNKKDNISLLGIGRWLNE